MSQNAHHPESSQQPEAPLAAAESASQVADRLFCSLHPSIEFRLIPSIDALGRAIAEHVPSPDLRRELWRILVEIVLQSDPTISAEGVIGFAEQMYQIASNADHTRKRQAQVLAGELPEPRIPSSRWQDCIDRFKDSLEDPAILGGDVAHMRECLEDAVDVLTANRRRLERMNESIFWTKGTPEVAVWSGTCPHQLDRIDEVVGRLKDILS